MVTQKEQHFREEPTRLHPAILKVEEKVQINSQVCPTFILQLAMHQVSINITVVRAHHPTSDQRYTQNQGDEA